MKNALPDGAKLGVFGHFQTGIPDTHQKTKHCSIALRSNEHVDERKPDGFGDVWVITSVLGRHFLIALQSHGDDFEPFELKCSAVVVVVVVVVVAVVVVVVDGSENFGRQRSQERKVLDERAERSLGHHEDLLRDDDLGQLVVDNHRFPNTDCMREIRQMN